MAAGMEDNYTAVLAAELCVGDTIIGADDGEYLIESIEHEVEHEYTLYCVNESGTAVKTNLPRNVHVNKIDYVEAKEGRFGMKLCDNCGFLRSKARGWTDDDYVCISCRDELNSSYA